MALTLHLIKPRSSSPFSRLILFSLVICSLFAFDSSEAADRPSAPPESSSPETFSLISHVPAKIALDITGWYRPVDESCRSVSDYKDESYVRHVGQYFNVPSSAQPHSTLRTIPLTYTVDACKLQLSQVKMKIRGRYGEQHWQETYYTPGLLIIRKTPHNVQRASIKMAFTK